MFKLLILISLLSASCAGYQLGGSKPAHLSHIQKIHVPLFKNDTLFMRAESLATNSMINTLTRDGTYKISSSVSADAVLLGRIQDVEYSQVSSTRTDSLRSEELGLRVIIDWSLVDATNGSQTLASGKGWGDTTLFARGNLNTARTNALPDALQRACESITARIADGF